MNVATIHMAPRILNAEKKNQLNHDLIKGLRLPAGLLLAPVM